MSANVGKQRVNLRLPRLRVRPLLQTSLVKPAYYGQGGEVNVLQMVEANTMYSEVQTMETPRLPCKR